MSVPNLDGMSEDELMAFWKRYNRPTRADAEELIGDRRKLFTVITSHLASYAVNKATSMGCRKRGDLAAATLYEGIAERIYERLPDDVRW